MISTPSVLQYIAAAAVSALTAAAGAQAAAGAALDGVGGPAALDALAKECYEARLVPDMPSAEVLDCSRIIEERSVGAERIVVTHKVRFTLLGRAGSARIATEAWTETEELGNVIEQPVTAEDYLRRAQRVLNGVVARLRSVDSPPWAGRYESEQAWRLDAHLNAVSHCDTNLATMSVESVTADLERIGLYPLHDGTRDRCEQLYAHLYEWALARGDANPTVAEYERYRAALPVEQRTCTGQLAPDAMCAP
jgi:hypothetical protein